MRVHRKVLTAPAIYLLAIGVSYISLTVTKLLFIAVVAVYILPDPLDPHHGRALSDDDEEEPQTPPQLALGEERRS
jgi:hypothetical protein